MRCPVRVHTGGHRAEPQTARQARGATATDSSGMFCVSAEQFSRIGSKLPLPTQQITVDRFNSFASANVQRRHRRLPQQNRPIADIGVTPSPCAHRLRHEAA
jgi:hypothetical protein